MSFGENSDAWGQLVSITDLDSAPVRINKDTFTIGRAKGCDLSFSANKLVSGNHCHIKKDEEGKVWLCDTSTNGTLLNLAEKVQKDCKEITHGDEFYVVYKKSDEDLNIGYMFQDIQELEKEADESTQDYNEELDSTLIDTEANEVSDHESRKRTQPDRGESPVPVPKRRKTDELNTADATTSQGRAGNHDNTEATSQAESGSSDGQVTGDTPEGKNTEKCGDTETKEDNTNEKKETKVESRDEIAETLVCIICQEILHDCISLQPCLHSFCAGCYSDWMPRSNECPSCRMKVQRINRNHMVNNLVEAYLKEHPDKKRPDEDIKELEAKNKITRDMLYPKHDLHYSDESDEEHDNSDDLSDSGSSDTGNRNHPAGNVIHVPRMVNLFGLGTPIFGAVQAPRVVCRQCPGYQDNDTITGKTAPPGGNTGSNSGEITAGKATEAASPSTSDQPCTSGTSSANQNSRDIKTMPTPPPFQCRANQNHVLCACCLQPMPDRRLEHQNNPEISPMSCLICYRNYCHAYWGCRKADCYGCFGKFGDMNFGKKCLVNLVLDNGYESEVLSDYLDSKAITVKEMLKACLTKMERGEYVCQDQARYNLTSQTWLCYSCALRNFKGLAYYYRRDIPRDQLPDAVTNRSDCYWGKNCRTQKNKPHHAQRFNHICDQCRTT